MLAPGIHAPGGSGHRWRLARQLPCREEPNRLARPAKNGLRSDAPAVMSWAPRPGVAPMQAHEGGRNRVGLVDPRPVLTAVKAERTTHVGCVPTG